MTGLRLQRRSHWFEASTAHPGKCGSEAILGCPSREAVRCRFSLLLYAAPGRWSWPWVDGESGLTEEPGDEPGRWYLASESPANISHELCVQVSMHGIGKTYWR